MFPFQSDSTQIPLTFEFICLIMKVYIYYALPLWSCRSRGIFLFLRRCLPGSYNFDHPRHLLPVTRCRIPSQASSISHLRKMNIPAIPTTRYPVLTSPCTAIQAAAVTDARVVTVFLSIFSTLVLHSRPQAVFAFGVTSKPMFPPARIITSSTILRTTSGGTSSCRTHSPLIFRLLIIVGFLVILTSWFRVCSLWITGYWIILAPPQLRRIYP